MAEKTYVVAVAHENMTVGQQVTVEEGQGGRLDSLLGAGYYYVKNAVFPVAPVAAAALDAEDDTDPALLERFEDHDVVEVAAPRRRRRPERETEER